MIDGAGLMDGALFTVAQRARGRRRTGGSPWCCFLVVFFSFIQGYSGTPSGGILAGGDPWGPPSGLWHMAGGGAGTRPLWKLSLTCGSAVMNSAMDGWLLMKPVSSSMAGDPELSRSHGMLPLQRATTTAASGGALPSTPRARFPGPRRARISRD